MSSLTPPPVEYLSSNFPDYTLIRQTSSQAPFAYLMKHAASGREVVLYLTPVQAASSCGWTADFLSHAKQAEKIRQISLLKIEASGETNGYYFLIIEHTADKAMEEMKPRLPLSPRDALITVKSVALGLTAAHEASIFHGRIDILAIHANHRNFCKISPLNPRPFRTAAQMSEFYSPQTFDLNHRLNAEDDTYSLGVILYWLLTGSTPAKKKHLMPSRLCTCSKDVDAVVAKAVNPKQGWRYLTLNDLIKAIDSVLPKAEKEKPKVRLPGQKQVIVKTRGETLSYFYLIPILILLISWAYVVLQYKTDLAERSKVKVELVKKLYEEKDKNARKAAFEGR